MFQRFQQQYVGHRDDQTGHQAVTQAHPIDLDAVAAQRDIAGQQQDPDHADAANHHAARAFPGAVALEHHFVEPAQHQAENGEQDSQIDHGADSSRQGSGKSALIAQLIMIYFLQTTGGDGYG